MAANKDPQILLLFLFLVHLSESSSPTTPSQAAGANRDTQGPRGRRPVEPHPDDYYEDPDDPTPEPVTPRPTGLQLCDYDTCLDEQLPCHLQTAYSHCLCPGLSSDLEPPLAPVLKRLTPEGSDVVVQWCAPHSYVTAYRVTVAGVEDPWEFRLSQRRAVVEGVAPGAEVCVVAVNEAGDSAASERSCMVFQPPGAGSVAVKAGLIGGALGFLLLLSLAVLLWRLRARRKARV